MILAQMFYFGYMILSLVFLTFPPSPLSVDGEGERKEGAKTLSVSLYERERRGRERLDSQSGWE
jgi:hypothetical protein